MINKQFFLLSFLISFSSFCVAIDDSAKISKEELFNFQTIVCKAINNFDLNTLKNVWSQDFYIEDLYGPSYSDFRIKKCITRDDIFNFIGLLKPEVNLANVSKEFVKGLACTRFEIKGVNAEIFGFFQIHWQINPNFEGISSSRFRAIAEKNGGVIFIKKIESLSEYHEISLRNRSFLWKHFLKYLYYFEHGIGLIDKK